MASDAVREKIAPLLAGKASDSGVTAKDSRPFLEAVLWRVRTGLPWRDLPGGFGKRNSAFQRFRRRVRAEVFDRVFRRVPDGPASECAPVGGTAVTARQKASSAKGGPGGRPSAAPVNLLGNLVRFAPLPGRRHGTAGVPPLVEGVASGALPGDEAFDVDRLRAEPDARGAAAVVPPEAGRKALIAHDRAIHRRRRDEPCRRSRS